VNLSQMDRLSVLACISGLALVLTVFAADWLGTSYPEWLPMVVASIAGFELFMVVDAMRKRSRGGA
jgi:zinc transporter ZupT